VTSKERVQTTLEFREPDKVPLGDFAIDFDTAAKVLGRETYVRAKAKTTIAYWEGRRDEVVQSLKADIPELFRKLGVYDIINLGCTAMCSVRPKGYEPQKPKQIAERTWETKDGRILKYSDITGDITCVHDPHTWERQFRAEDFDLDPQVGPPDESVFEVYDVVTEAFKNEKYLIGPFPQAPEQVLLGGMERGLVEIAEHPEVVQRAVEAGIARARKAQRYWRNRGWDATMNGTDFGYRAGPYASPRVFRELFLPAVRFNVESAHAHGLKFIQHACGNNWPILDGFIEAGIDCYQSVQASADMDIGEVKKASAPKMAVWGGVRVENLVSGTMEDVRKDVRYAMEVAKEGGGFILGSTHSIAVGTKYDNFMAMLDEFEKLREY